MMIRLFRHSFIRTALFLIFSIVAFQYFQTKIYDLPEASPFRGDSLYNPYGVLRNGRWLKANFHAHAKSWHGLTNGKQTSTEIVKTYRGFGYDIAGVSNYHQIDGNIYAASNMGIPVYEHGMNLHKQHYLEIGATHVSFFDVMLWQNLHVKQSIIKIMNEHAGIVCMNHPGLRKGHSTEDVAQLTGYHCMEALNGHRQYVGHWDAALSAGRPVWIVGNDDSHDVYREQPAQSWNLIYSADPTQRSILEAMRSGASMAVHRTKNFGSFDSLREWAAANKGDLVSKVLCDGPTVTVALRYPAKKIKWIGQNGTVKATFLNADTAQYTFRQEDTYIRAEIETGTFTLYLNPVLRFDGNSIPQNVWKAETNLVFTLLWRLGILMVYIAMLYVLFPATRHWLLFGSTPEHYAPYPS